MLDHLSLNIAVWIRPVPSSMGVPPEYACLRLPSEKRYPYIQYLYYTSASSWWMSHCRTSSVQPGRCWSSLRQPHVFPTILEFPWEWCCKTFSLQGVAGKRGMMGECPIKSPNSRPELSTKLGHCLSGLSLFRFTSALGRQVIYPFFSPRFPGWFSLIEQATVDSSFTYNLRLWEWTIQPA